MPNRVSCNGSNEITLQELVTAINLIDYERGGIAWKTALPYQPGDLVSLDLAGPGMYELYRCTSPHTSVDITVPAEFNNWELVTSAELGGVHYKGASGYSAGDIVTADVDNGVDPITTSVYRCTSTYTSGAGTPVSFNAEIANWTEIAGAPERGGVQHSSGTDYVINDLVVDPTDNATYRCIRDHLSIGGNNPDGEPSTALQTAWALSTADERGGVFYKQADYKLGDIITAEVNDGTNPLYTEIFRCITPYTSVGLTPFDFFAEIGNWVPLEDPHGYVQETNTSFTPDAFTDDFFDYTMAGHTNIQPPLNIEAGKSGTLVLRQDGLGNHLPMWSSNYQFPDGMPILDTSPYMLHLFEYKAISDDILLMEFVANHIPTAVTITAIITISDFIATDTLPGEIEVTFTEQ